MIINGSTKKERFYINDFELWQQSTNGTIETERETLSIADDQKSFLQFETLTIDSGNTVSMPTTNWRYQYDNHLGSACLELDDSANVISYEEYFPFGSTSYRSGKSAAEASLKRYRYCGKERDEETGLYYYGARYYAAWIGRFISVDPLAEKFPQLTPYNYAGNKPITYKDLHGLQSDGGDEPVENQKPDVVEDLEDLPQKVIKGLADDLDNLKKSISKSWNKIFSSDSANDNELKVDAISGASIPTSKANKPKEEKINYAQKLLDSKNVTFIELHPNKHTPNDEANASDNIKDAAKGKAVKLSNYGNAPGGTVELSEKLLKGLYELSKDYEFSIQELAGASHSKNSTHYKGKAVDINWLNGKHVGADHPDAKKFIKAAKKLGFSVNNEWKMAKGAHFHMYIE